MEFVAPKEFEELRETKDSLYDKLKHHRNVNGAGLAKDELGWYIKVNLVKQHQWWHRKLPTKFKGVRVRYQVVGVIRAL